jgi:arylsulfatase A-like enzyme
MSFAGASDLTPPRAIAPLLAAVLAGALIAGVAAGDGQPGAPASADAAEPPPNIVMIMTDDQNARDIAVMKKTRRLLIDEGARLETYVDSFSLCCPARAAYVTGQYSHNNGVLNSSRAHPDGGYPALHDKANILPAWLQTAGYDTAHIGKYLNGYGNPDRRDVPSGWTQWWGAPDPKSYQMYKWILNDDGDLIRFGTRRRDYQTDVYARYATKFIRRESDAGTPFFLSVAPLAPHDEREVAVDDSIYGPRPAPRHRGRFSNRKFFDDRAFNERNVGDKPHFVQVKPRLGRREKAIARRSNRARLASLLAVDDLVQDVIQELRDTGQLDNTYVFFTTDNGYLLGQHRLFGKNVAYLDSSQLPLVVRGPGIDAGSTIGGVAANVDLAPTIADLAGATPTRAVDGISLRAPLLSGTAIPDRDVLHESFQTRSGVKQHGIANGPGTHTGVRTERYVYIRYLDGFEELYDLETDPDQLTNVADKPSRQVLRAQLEARLEVLEDCAGATCR